MFYIKVLLLKIYLYVCECVSVCERLCMPSVFLCPRRPEESTGCLKLDLQEVVSGSLKVLGTELGSLQEQHLFLTPEPSVYLFSFDL